MPSRCLWLFACLLALAGCANAPLPNSSTAQLPWHDEAFGYDAQLVTVTKGDLLKLDPQMLEELRAPALRRLRPQLRLERLMTMLFGPPPRYFSYNAGHSTTASETWRLRRGDCLSLSILTYAMGRAMDMSPQIQEVDVPAMYDRRGNFDFVNQHVNVLFRHVKRGMADALGDSPDLIVDFEPEFGTNRRGRALDEDGALARYYNNLGVEYLAAGRRSLAYAHLKAAIMVDPSYAASYTNLALLYRNSSMAVDAEVLLLRAVALSEPADVALRSMYQLLVDEGRDAEAQQYAKRLQALRDRDPYYWLTLGVHYLEDAENRRAVDALEHALEITNGFAEIHRYLAVAYWRVGNQARANEQLDALAQLDSADPFVSTLRKKFGTANR